MGFTTADLFEGMTDPNPSKKAPPTPPAADSKTIELNGIVEVVRYFKNGFAIFKLDNNPLFIKGNVQSIAKGMRMQVLGEKQQDSYGWGIKASAILPAMMNTAAAGDGALLQSSFAEMTAYLGSGILEGVGEAIAHRMVVKFGKDDIAEVIEKNPEKLTAISGISSKKAMAIHASWLKNKATHEVFMFLKGHGVSLLKAGDIVDHFSPTKQQINNKWLKGVISNNPYMICAVDGIGFKTADSLALSLGIASNSAVRIQHGVEFAFLESIVNETGSTGAPYDDIVKATSILLEQPLKNVMPVFNDMLDQDDRFVTVGETIFHAKNYNYEKNIASRLAQLMQAKIPPLDNIEQRIAQAEQDLNAKLPEKKRIHLSETQKRELIVLIQNPVCILTGQPGTGKTTILKVLLKVLTPSCPNKALAAPAGKAASRMEEATGHPASTCHRLLDMEDGEFVHDENTPLPFSLIGLDEWSMTGVSLMSHMMNAIKKGTRVIFAGDIYQLPSVDAGRVFADMIESNTLPVARLTEIRRQEDGSFISLAADAVNQGKIPTQFNEAFSLTQLEEPTAQEAAEGLTMAGKTLPAVLKLVQEYMNKGINIDDIQVLSPMRKFECGANRLNAEIQKMVNPNSRIAEKHMVVGDKIFALGDRVLQTKNDRLLKIFNGDSGKIVHINKESNTLRVDFEKFEIEIPSGKLNKLDLFYATTVHKGQGSGFKHVIMPVITSHYMMLKRNLLYTGITRGIRSVRLVTDDKMKAIRTAVRTEDTSSRVTSLKMHLMEMLPQLARVKVVASADALEVPDCDDLSFRNDDPPYFDDVPL